MRDYRSFHDSLLEPDWKIRIARCWPQVVSTSASIIAVIGIVVSLFIVDDKNDTELLYATELSLFSLFLLGYVIFSEYRYARKARYAEAMASIHSAIHILRDYQCDFNSICEDHDCKNALSSVVTAFANAFSLVTGTHCRSCIKTIETRNISQSEFNSLTPQEQIEYLYVATFCRDRASANNENESDNYIHPLSSNTDFLVLYNDVSERRYFSNDINKEDGYQNSSHQANKKLPYRSTIVWPIRKLMYAQDRQNEKEQIILGYLCVDSARMKVFREDYDFEMGATVADALFLFLKSYHNYLKSKNKNNKSENHQKKLRKKKKR